jgi:hypothetical protein
MPMQGTGRTTLESWIAVHRPLFEMWRLEQLVDGRRAQIGYRLELTALCPRSGCRGACCADVEIWERLAEVARTVAPDDHAELELEIEPYDASHRCGPDTSWAPAVRLTAQVVHREHYFEEVDADDRRILGDVEERLAALRILQGCVAA